MLLANTWKYPMLPPWKKILLTSITVIILCCFETVTKCILRLHRYISSSCSYDKVVAKLINELSVSDDVHFLIATHNEHSLKSASSRIQQLGIDPADSRVGFAQLYGLSDHLSNWLGKTVYTPHDTCSGVTRGLSQGGKRS